MRLRIIKTACLGCCFLAHLSGVWGPAAGGEGWAGPNRPVYVVTQNHYAEGSTPAGATARFGDWIAIEIFHPEPPPVSPIDSHAVGERYALFAGGQKLGDVQVDRVTPLQCGSFAAMVSFQGVHLPPAKMALATNAEAARPHINVQRDADPAEQAYARQLAAEELHKQGVPFGRAEELNIERLVVTEADGSGRKVLIGSLSAKANGVQHEVFLIGGVAGLQPAAELSRYHKTTDPDGKDSENLRFVDQLDLDGDGTDEMVVEVTGYEYEAFWIYQWQNGFWKQVWVGGEGGC